jgi:hypothetical protein
VLRGEVRGKFPNAPPFPSQGEGELNIERTAVRPYGSPSPLSGTRGEGMGAAQSDPPPLPGGMMHPYRFSKGACSLAILLYGLFL